MLSIACISQKGGVGKSTLSRLIARTYAAAGWQVKIADFNTKQKTAVDWAAVRMSQNLDPIVDAAPYSTLRQALADAGAAHLMVMDGKPDSDTVTLDIAKFANLLILPTGVTQDDLFPQVRFANELKTRGITTQKMLFVLNKTTGSETWNTNTRGALTQAGYSVAETDLAMRTGYMAAQNSGRAISETAYQTLNDRAESLAQEVVVRLTQLAGL